MARIGVGELEDAARWADGGGAGNEYDEVEVSRCFGEYKYDSEGDCVRSCESRE